MQHRYSWCPAHPMQLLHSPVPQIILAFHKFTSQHIFRTTIINTVPIPADKETICSSTNAGNSDVQETVRPGTSGKVYTNTIQGLTLTLVHSHGETKLQRKLYSAQSKRQRCLVGGEDHAGQVVYFTFPCPITNFNLQTPAHSAMINDASPVAQRSRDVL